MILKQMFNEMALLETSIAEAQHTLDAFKTVTAYMAHRNGGKKAERAAVDDLRVEVADLGEETKLIGPARNAVPYNASGSIKAGFWDRAIVAAIKSGARKPGAIWSAVAKRYHISQRKRPAFYQALVHVHQRGLVSRDSGDGGKYSLPGDNETTDQKVKHRKRLKSRVFPWKKAMTSLMRDSPPLTSNQIWTAIAGEYNLEKDRKVPFSVALSFMRRHGYLARTGTLYTIGPNAPAPTPEA